MFKPFVVVVALVFSFDDSALARLAIDFHPQDVAMTLPGVYTIFRRKSTKMEEI
jgi:hypothetical protein